MRTCKLIHHDGNQLSFLPEQKKDEKIEDMEKANDQIRRRFGHFSIQRGIMLTEPDKGF